MKHEVKTAWVAQNLQTIYPLQLLSNQIAHNSKHFRVLFQFVGDLTFLFFSIFCIKRK